MLERLNIHLMKTILAFCFFSIAFGSQVQPDAATIMSKSRDLTLMGSMKATIHMSITEKNGSSRNRTIEMTTKTYPDGQEKRLIRFLEPADVKGTSMLIVDNPSSQDEMWIYLPALKKVRRIVSTEKGRSFMSSEFTNADMSSPVLADFRHSFALGSGTNNVWIIESVPMSQGKADENGYSLKVSYLSSNDFRIKNMEFYNFDNELFKRIIIKAVFPLSEGRYIIKDMEAVNLLNGRKSEIVLTNIYTGVTIDDAVFSLQNLER
jgi:hypothetical protein